MKLLITGGAGYIGAITAKELEKAGHQVLVYDHFFSHTPAKLGSTPYVKGGLLDAKALTKALSSFHPDVVMHFAAYIQMGESVANPRKYYDNNFIGMLSLVETMIKVGCHKLVFASTAGVYGNPVHLPIPENDPKEPENPYGETKLSVERLLKWYDKAYGFKSISIRFFNAAGATEELGEDHHDESHLIPNIIRAQLAGEEFTLFGDDYPTPDGTCVRDYIHVLDLASAFTLAAEHLMSSEATTTCYNAGTGTGYSNKQVIAMVEKISGQPVKVKSIPRRPGDANELVADSSRLRAELSWSPKYSDLESIIKSAYKYHITKI
jgi:UDP-glucose-4-epimerase GalE